MTPADLVEYDSRFGPGVVSAIRSREGHAANKRIQFPDRQTDFGNCFILLDIAVHIHHQTEVEKASRRDELTSSSTSFG